MRDQSLLVPDFIRSAVVYLKQEDPRRRHRERIVCAVNVGDFELRYPSDPGEPERRLDDGRTVRRQMWDEAVHALIRITEECGLYPKSVRNDKNSCRLVMRQDSAETSKESARFEDPINWDEFPDEYFRMELFYSSEFELENRRLDYVKRIHQFDESIQTLKQELNAWTTPKYRKKEIAEKIKKTEQDRKFYLSTTPDPREMDGGLIFKIEMLSLKEYGTMKDKLTVVLNKFIAELSRIACENGTKIPGLLRLAN